METTFTISDAREEIERLCLDTRNISCAMTAVALHAVDETDMGAMLALKEALVHVSKRLELLLERAERLECEASPEPAEEPARGEDIE